MQRRFMHMAAWTTLALCAALNVCHAQTVFQGAGTTQAAKAINDFRTAIGGGPNTAPSPQIGGRREINWDGVLLDGTDFGGNTVVIDRNHTVGIPVNRFQARGAIFAEVYAVSGDGFASVNPATAGDFPAFSPKNVFSMFSDNTIEMKFVQASAPTTAPIDAGVRGFGAIFVDVQLADNSSIEYFNGSTSLGKYFVTPGNPGDPEFLGVLFDQPVVTSVELTVGNKILFFFDGKKATPGGAKNLADGEDISVLDDFVYSEPIEAAPVPAKLTAPHSLIGGQGATGTIHLSADAPSGGEVVNLVSSQPSIVAVPATVTVPAGSNSAAFPIATRPTPANTSAVITASASGINTSATLAVKAPTPALVDFSPALVVGGKSTAARVALNGPAAVNTVVTLTITAGNSAIASMPASVTIPAGATQTTFKVVTKQVNALTTVQIEAAANGASKPGDLRVIP